MQIPRDETLGEVIYREIDKNEYLIEIYNNLLFNYSIDVFKLNLQRREVNIAHALRFADLLSKSTYKPLAEKHKMQGQEIGILLSLLYPNDKTVKYYLSSILSTLGNYRGLESESVKGYDSIDFFDSLFYEYDKNNHIIPGESDKYFFHNQKAAYEGLENKCFSYSGPTSMGKSFIVQTYIEQQVRNGVKKNFAILVPTKALINEVKRNIISVLQNDLYNQDYRVVTTSEDLVLKQKHNFIFVLTPERMLYLLLSSPYIKIDFIFIDEANKIFERGGRSTYYYKILSQLNTLRQTPNIIFASPNIPNPEVFLKMIPFKDMEMIKLVSKYSPVCQFKFYLDFYSNKMIAYNDYAKEEVYLPFKQYNNGLVDLINEVEKEKQNLVYCSSKKNVLDLSYEYSKYLKPLNNDKLNELAKDIRRELNPSCSLANLVQCGVAYHVGYLPASIRLRIEEYFEKGYLRTIFCTSTLIEGVNLPADNLFVTSYKTGKSNMDEVGFRNLIGRVGRIKYNLYGNVFFIRLDDKLKDSKYISLLKNDVPNQKLSIDIKENTKLMKIAVKELSNGNLELTECYKNKKSEKDYNAVRKLSLMLTRDIVTDNDSPIVSAFKEVGALDDKLMYALKREFSISNTSDDFTFSDDQSKRLAYAIECLNLEYPKLSGINYAEDNSKILNFLLKLKRIFKWDIYERQTLGHSNKIEWYASLLHRWILGNGINSIIESSIRYRDNHPEKGVYIGKHKVKEFYTGTTEDKNYVIADALSDIETIILFQLVNYFRKFSLEYKRINGIDSFYNDWYEYTEFGTMNPTSIFLQQSGFTRESSTYIQNNISKYVVFLDNEIKIKRTIFECSNVDVRNEANDIKFNIPELFID